MRLTNTSDYSTAEVRELVEFGMRGVKTAGVAVHVRNNRVDAYRGAAYRGVPSCSPRSQQATVRYLVTLRIGKPDKFPTTNYCEETGIPWGGKRCPQIEMRCWKEAMVMLAAHEARHIHQYLHKLPASESDCERFAAKRLEAWRKESAPS